MSSFTLRSFELTTFRMGVVDQMASKADASQSLRRPIFKGRIPGRNWNKNLLLAIQQYLPPPPPQKWFETVLKCKHFLCNGWEHYVPSRCR
jgi:hypothetical protein